MEPISTAIGLAITGLVKTAPKWLPPIRDAFLDKAREQGAEFVTDKGKKGWRDLFRLDEKEQIRHLQLAIKNAAERGLAQFDTLEERDLYRSILEILSEEGPRNEALRREAMSLFTLSDSPDFTALAETYHLAQRISALAQHKIYAEVDIAPYLSTFFNALIAELYIDPLFNDRISDIIRVRVAKTMQQSLEEQAQATMNMQRSLREVLTTLRQIYSVFEQGYTVEQFEKDVQAYTEHIERTLHYLKLVGVAHKEGGNENRDPELNGIFVPLRVASKEQNTSSKQTKEETTSDKELKDSIIDVFQKTSCLILLGDPGSGKSIATRHLAWSHAVANLSNSTSLTNASLLPGKPLPMRIELRRLSEDRKQRPDYDFLTYTCQVLLGRAGLNIPRQMFEILLERRTVLILFDGLDEVATIKDRDILVGEIESFAQRYPGNRFLVTSRKVGYELTPLSDQLFSHAWVQPFNDSQIHLFLERWYAHVLGLSPIPDEEQQELKELYTTLKDDPGLHDLAENPLLLTVITSLYRYERLPDRKIEVYDRCADLLLEIWAKLKGTNIRWQDLKLSKGDRYACIARLGFILHKRSQEKLQSGTNSEKTSSNSDLTNDIPFKSMLREIELFLQNQKLFSSIAEQNAQAERFLELIQEEAGLIVERGTDEDGERLYGFVHRTFQEYFAAADVYECYLQEGNSTIISEFLREHLHDPHWYEVIHFLFGKLKRKQATAQFGQILEGKNQSRRSLNNDILQQDLFSICLCLIDEISVENDLADSVIADLSKIVKNSPFLSQRFQALEVIGILVQTRQYTDSARKALMEFITEDTTVDISTKIRAARVVYDYNSKRSDDKHQAISMLNKLSQWPSLPLEQSLQIAETLYHCCPAGSEQEQDVIQTLLELAQRPGFSFEEVVLIIQPLYQVCSPDSLERQQANQLLSDWIKRSDNSFTHLLQVALTLFLSNPAKSSRLDVLADLLLMRYSSERILYYLTQLKRLVRFNIHSIWEVEMFLDIINQADFDLESALQLIQNIQADYFTESGGERQAIHILSNLVQRPGLSFEQTLLATNTLYECSTAESQEEQQARQILLDLTQQPDLSFEQTILVAHTLHECSTAESQEEQQARQILLDLTQQPDLSFEQTVLVARALYECSTAKSQEEQRAIQMLSDLAERPDLSFEQILQVALSLYMSSPRSAAEEQKALRMLSDLAERPDLSFEQILQVALSIYLCSSDKLKQEQQAMEILLETVQKTDLPIEQVAIATEALYWLSPSQSDEEKPAISLLWQLTEQQGLTFEQKLHLATQPLAFPESKYQDKVKAVQTILGLMQPEAAKHYIAKHWLPFNISSQKIALSDIPHLIELIKQEILPPPIRNIMYEKLRDIVPQFDRLSAPEN